MRVDVIDPNKTAMIVVDMQNDFVASGAAMETPAARQIVPKIAEALRLCRDVGVKIIYTAHVHRRDGCDMGLFDDLHPPIANRDALVDCTHGVEIYADLAPASGDATATYDYPDRGFGSMSAAEIHHATIVILAASTAHVMSVDDMKTRIMSHLPSVTGAAVH